MSIISPFENQIVEGDSLHILKQIEDDSIDSIVTDPPYGYSFMNKDWDKAVVSVDIWKECLRVMKAGSFAFIMSSPRQDVLCKMILNLIDAGFETNFTSIYWTYASGFPKAANVSKLVDKRLGAEREKIETNGKLHKNRNMNDDGWSKIGLDKPLMDSNIPKSEPAKKLDGSYAGFQPKPALETILVVMKPLSEKSYVDQALSNGKGISWLEDCRIPFQDEKDKSSDWYSCNDQELLKTDNIYGKFKERVAVPANSKGRFPANILCSDDSLNDGKIRKTGTIEPHHNYNWTKRNTYGKYNHHSSISYGDSGSYSRYFDLDSWYNAQFIITPKASPSERQGSTHPTMKPIKLMSYLITMGSRENDLILDPFCGSGTTCIAALQLNRRFIGIELNKEYVDIANKRLEPYKIQNKITQF